MFGFFKKKPEHLLLGIRGEKIARKYLRRQKMRLLKKNFRCQFGEIDLIMQDGPELVFVEVKTRTTEVLYTAEQAVDRDKQQKIIQSARHFISRYRLAKHPCRFDIVAVIISDNTTPEIRHTKDAFAVKRNQPGTATNGGR